MSFSHIRLTQCSALQVFEDLERNEEYVRTVIPGHRFSSFAYPNGDVSLGWKLKIGHRFGVARGIEPGINGSKVDRKCLKAFPFYSGRKRWDFGQLLDQLQATRGWLNIFTHDVSSQPTAYGCTPQELDEFLNEVSSRKLVCVPVAEAAKLIES
jgi:peptidoglycan/xylan/chitin deacetylase (PgdA/CDA1 family)